MNATTYTVNNAREVKIAGAVVAHVELLRLGNDSNRYAWHYRAEGGAKWVGEYRTRAEAAAAAVAHFEEESGEVLEVTAKDVEPDLELRYEDGQEVHAYIGGRWQVARIVSDVDVDREEFNVTVGGRAHLVSRHAVSATPVDYAPLEDEAPVQLELDLDATIYGDKDGRAPLITEASAKADADVLDHQASTLDHQAGRLAQDGQTTTSLECSAEAARLRDKAQRRRAAWATGGVEGLLECEAGEWARGITLKATRRQLAELIEVLRDAAPEILGE